MSVEVTNTIEGLVNTNPEMIDPVYNGPKHFWLIKTVLKHIFPGSSGNGFATPILATEAELNYMQGASANVQDQIDGLRLPVKLADGTTIANVTLNIV